MGSAALKTAPTDFYASQVFIDPGYEDFTCTIADDFYVSQPWSVESLYFPGGWWPNNNIAHAIAVDVGIHANIGGQPGPSFLLLSLPINSPYVTLYLNAHGTPGDIMVKLPYPIVLQPGHYWLSFSPYLNYTWYGQWGRAQSDTSNLHRAL